MKRAAVFFVALGLVSCGDCRGETGSPDTEKPVVEMGPDVAPDVRDFGRPRDAARDTGSDMGRDSGPGPQILGSEAVTPVQEGVSPDGVLDVLPVVGNARAARFLAPDTGFRGVWALCKEGDLKLFNGEVEACIAGVDSNRHDTASGGLLVDVRPTGLDAEDVFDIYMPRVGFNTPLPSVVEVIRDGTDGGPAVIRATGTDMPVDYFVGVLGDQLFRPGGLQVTVEYRLGPTADFIEIVTFVHNPTDVPVQTTRGDLLAMGDRLRTFREGAGLGPSSSSYQAIHAFGEGYSFAWLVPGAQLQTGTGGLDAAPWEITERDRMVLAPGEGFVHRGRLIVGRGTLDEVRVRADEELGRGGGTPRTIRVVGDAGVPVVGRLVEVFSGDDAVSADVTNAAGEIVVTLADGTYRIDVAGVLGGGGADEPWSTGSEVEHQVVVPSTGKLVISATDGTAALPALIDVSGPAGMRTATGLEPRTIEVVPGQWRVVLGHGPEWSHATQEVSVAAGAEVAVVGTLTRAFDTSDWIVADFHQHMEPSPDSTVRVEDRILDNAGVGIELLTPTDHDVVTNLAPYLVELGLDAVMSTFPGVEISPSLAHMNLYPMDWSHDARGGGTIPLAGTRDGRPRRQTIPEIIALARALPSNPVVQLNHGRGTGLFALTGFDPEVGPDAVNHAWWTTDFDAMEIFNSFGDSCAQFSDWAGLWNAGLTPTPIGSSDAHGVWGEIGEARTYLHAPGVAPNAATPELARDVVRAGRVVVGSHAFVEFTDGRLPGDTVVAGASPVDFALRISTPPWAEVDTLHVVVNGAVVESLPVTPVDGTLDFDGTYSRGFAADSWVAFVATGPAPAGEYRPNGRITYALTNPVRIDAGGDGFTPAGPGPLDLDALPFCP